MSDGQEKPNIARAKITIGEDLPRPATNRSAQIRSLRLPPPNSSGSRNTLVAWSLVLLFAGISGFLIVDRRRAEEQLTLLENELEDANMAEIFPTAPGLKTPDKASDVGEIALESKGYVTPAHQILVSPQVSGRLTKLYVEEGRRVAQGDVLGEIETTEYRADFQRAQATHDLCRQRLLELENGSRPEEIDQAKAELAESEAQLVQLESEWRRGSQLVLGKVITTQDYELIDSRYRMMQRRVDRLRLSLKLATDGPRLERIEVARAEVKQAEADVAKTKWRLDNCRILAPISGTILKKNAEEGNIVNPIAFNGSYSVCEMADLSDLEVSLDVQERDIARVFKGQKCRVRAVDAFPDRNYEGVVARLMPIADRAKGAIQVRVRLQVPADEEGVYLKPEMGVTVSFLSGPPSDKPVADKTNSKRWN
jgi:HlyD family secretion protein